MRIPQVLLDKIEEYKSKYRRSDVGNLEWSKPYELSPRAKNPDILQWPAGWPHSKRAGVYFVLARDGLLLYVGKASMRHCIGKRLSSYFGTNRASGDCEILDPNSWDQELRDERMPAFVVALAVPEGMSFEAAAIEEYMIRELIPPANTRGVAKSSSSPLL